MRIITYITSLEQYDLFVSSLQYLNQNTGFIISTFKLVHRLRDVPTLIHDSHDGYEGDTVSTLSLNLNSHILHLHFMKWSLLSWLPHLNVFQRNLLTFSQYKVHHHIHRAVYLYYVVFHIQVHRSQPRWLPQLNLHQAHPAFHPAFLLLQLLVSSATLALLV